MDVGTSELEVMATETSTNFPKSVVLTVGSPKRRQTDLELLTPVCGFRLTFLTLLKYKKSRY